MMSFCRRITDRASQFATLPTTSRRIGYFIPETRRLNPCFLSTTTTNLGRLSLPPMPRVLPTKGAAPQQQLSPPPHTGRTPLPPMPRILSSQLHPPPPPPPPGLLRKWWQSGSILLVVGWTGLAVWVLDQYLQYQQRLDAAEAVEAMADDAKRQKLALRQKWHNQPALFHCTIRRAHKNMGGSYGLKNVRVGDVVEVLEEGVGPDRHYNLCRIHKNNSDNDGATEQIGWFPISYMEKLEPAPKPSWWRRILRRD